jgi:hypothetical protein
MAVAAVTVLAAAPSIGAQTSFGIKGGIALANMYGDAVGNVDLRNGFTGGIFMDVPVTPKLFFTPQAMYTQKGAKESALINIGQGATIAHGTWKYDYVDIAALLKAKLGNGPVKFDIYGGPMYSVLMSAKAVGDGGELDLKDLTKSHDIGGLIGGTLELPGGLIFDLSYSMGTLEFDEPPLDVLYSRKQNVIAASIGFRG